MKLNVQLIPWNTGSTEAPVITTPAPVVSKSFSTKKKKKKKGWESKIFLPFFVKLFKLGYS